MLSSFRHLNYILMGISILILMTNQLLPNWSHQFELEIFVVLMILCGIPHGATDHLVYEKRIHDKGRTFSWINFFGQYLGMMILYGLLWSMIPKVSFLLFLFVSFYHFGQSELFFLPLPEFHWLKKTLYVSWGGLILLLILQVNWDEASLILADGFLEIGPYLCTVPAILSIAIFVCSVWTVGGWLFILVRYPSSLSSIFVELLSTGLLIMLIHQTSLLVSFSLYFGLWHAVKTIWAELESLQRTRPHFHLFDWIKAAAPFSIISFMGIGGLLWISQECRFTTHPIFIFFVLISMLTMPHMRLIETIYAHVGYQKVEKF